MADELRKIAPANPIEPTESLRGPTEANLLDQAVHPQQTIYLQDSAVTKAEKHERHGDGENAAKRIRLDPSPMVRRERVKGVAPIKPDFLLQHPNRKGAREDRADDAAEGAAQEGDGRDQRKGKGKKNKGQNTHRTFGFSRDEVGLCSSRANRPEFSPEECQFGSDCKYEHNLRKYLKEWKREDLTTFGGVCPLWKANGWCDAGWKCRFSGSHSKEVEREDGHKELVLVEAEANGQPHREQLTNDTSPKIKMDLARRNFATPRAERFIEWINKNGEEVEHRQRDNRRRRDAEADPAKEPIEEHRAQYTEPPFLPSEKRKIYFGRETPVLAPLTTQGNLPFRRLCVSLGAQATYSEMAMSLPLIQGQKSEWALMRAHVSETRPPAYNPKDIVAGYDNSKDFKFGAQIAANKPWAAIKATEVITSVCPHLRVVDLNCGCPIDLVYRTGAGSALLDAGGKLEKMLRGMNSVSGEVPTTVKIRMGTRDNKPTALKLVDRLVYGGEESYDSGLGACGVAAITLHGRTRQQRYTRSADWEYIAHCAALIKEFNEKGDNLADTAKEVDGRDQSSNGKVYFLGNGDCYSHTDYFDHLDNGKVDSVMIARGALIKPWIFEEIEKGQYLDKTASERFQYVEHFVRNGLEVWGSDERGVGLTRRFLLEWLSFAYRYVPVGLLEHLPPSLQDRPPAWRGRDDLETLLGSGDYRDWIKISEMFLGPAHKDFKFQPKHKSNSYEIEAEG